MNKKIKIILGIFVGAIILIGVTGYILNSFLEIPEFDISIGSEGTIDGGDQDEIFVTSNFDSQKNFIRNIVNSNDQGFEYYQKLLYSGEGYNLENNTKIIILGGKEHLIKFRILEGAHKDKIAWTAYEWIKYN